MSQFQVQKSPLSNRDQHDQNQSSPQNQEGLQSTNSPQLEKINCEDKSLSSSEKQNKFEPEKLLQRVKSSQQLRTDFQENQKILTSLNSNIDDLFKKISQLTQQVATQSQSKRQKIGQTNSTKNSPSKINSSSKLSAKSSNGNENQIQVLDSPETKKNTQLVQSSTSKKISQTDLTVSLENIKNYNLFLGTSLVNQQQVPLSMKDFQTGKNLGHGKFGQVLQCRHLNTGTLYALKKIFKSTIQQYNMQDQLLVQIEAQKRINHPNIVQTYKSFTDPYHIFILMQYIQGIQLIKKFKSQEKFVSIIMKQILQAIKAMHQIGVAHRDLKPENIIVNQKNNEIKITDFGWASIDGKQMNIMCGTLDYLSPQMAQGIQYDKRVDLWSVGVLTYELIYGRAPFKGSNKQETIQNVKNLKYQFPPKAMSNTKKQSQKEQEKQSPKIEISQCCKNFIQGFLKQADQRQTLQWGLQHQFIKSFNDKNIQDSEIQNELNSLF